MCSSSTDPYCYHFLLVVKATRHSAAKYRASPPLSNVPFNPLAVSRSHFTAAQPPSHRTELNTRTDAFYAAPLASASRFDIANNVPGFKERAALWRGMRGRTSCHCCNY